METKKVTPITPAPGSDLNQDEQILPVKIADDLANQEATELVPSDSPRKDALVPVVDDNVDNIALLSLDLQQEGYRVVTASNGEEAVKVASLMRPDLIHPDGHRHAFAGPTAKIREDESLRSTPIVAVTAFSTAEFRRAAYDVGFDGYLTKPINFDQLHELIHRLPA